MARDTTVLKLNFEYWLDKAIKWGQATTLESQKDVCLHLPQLQEFLQEIYETLKHMDSIAAIQQFPLIGQLLGRLCWNPFVIGYDESQKTLMWCLCCLYSSEPQNPVELKANSWIRSLLCHLLSSSKWESNEAETSTFISSLGYTSADYYYHLIKNMVFSLVTELRGNQFNGLNIQGRVSASRVNAVSRFCLPLVTLPDLTPLLETLLLYHGGASEEILSSEFLEAVNEAFLKKKISLPESAIFSLWLRHLPSLEKATLHLLDQLISSQLNSVEEVACVIKDSSLPQAASHPAIFRVVNEIFKSLRKERNNSLIKKHVSQWQLTLNRNVLLETDGTPEVITIIQVFTQLFLQAHQNENKQHKFPLKAYFPYHHQPLVTALLRRPFELPTTHLSQHLKHISDMLKALVEDPNIRNQLMQGEAPEKVRAAFGNDIGAADIGATTERAETAVRSEVECTRLLTRHCDNTGKLMKLVLWVVRSPDKVNLLVALGVSHLFATADNREVHGCTLSSSLADLFEIWFLVVHFGEWLDIAAEQLLKAAIEPDALLWLLAFYYCPQNENQQRTQTMVEAQAVYNHLMMRFSCTVLSVKDLEAAVHSITDIEQCCNQHLITHLLTNFLLFSSGGHMIAQEFIYHITEVTDTSKEVCNLLMRTAYRINHNGEEHGRTVKLLNELLQKLTLKV